MVMQISLYIKYTNYMTGLCNYILAINCSTSGYVVFTDMMMFQV